MSVIYRQAVYDDLDGVCKIERACFKQPWSMESLRNDICINELALYTVAETDGALAGYCSVHIIGDEGHITNIAVLPEYRMRGIGRGLLETLFMQTGLPYYTLEVRASNNTAINLYAKLGFSSCGRRPRYYGDEDALIMWRGKSH